MNDCITVREAADRLGIKSDALRDEIRAGRTPFTAWARRCDGGKWSFVIPREGFEYWMNGSVPPTAEQIAEALAVKLAPSLPDMFFHCFDVNRKSEKGA